MKNRRNHGKEGRGTGAILSNRTGGGICRKVGVDLLFLCLLGLLVKW